MYLQNKYTKWYYDIILHAQSRTVLETYLEKHHVVPKSIGGSNRQDNLVKLTAREHFICHHLLTKMLTGDKKQKMIYAFWQLANQRNSNQSYRYIAKSRAYEAARKLFVECHTQRMKANPPMNNPEVKKNHRLSMANRKGKPGIKGHKHSEATKEKFRNKEWTDKAIQTRLNNCLKNAAKRKGQPRSETLNQSIFNSYLKKNVALALKVFELYDTGISKLQVAKRLGVSWEKVKYSLQYREDFEKHR